MNHARNYHCHTNSRARRATGFAETAPQPRRKTYSIGTRLQAAEKLIFLKGTAFRPYVNAFEMNSALAAEG
jgi:hypothetical protein